MVTMRSDIRDVMLVAVEQRFGSCGTPHPVEMPSGSVSVLGDGGNSAPLVGVSEVAIEVYGQGVVCRLHPATERTYAGQDHHVFLRAA